MTVCVSVLVNMCVSFVKRYNEIVGCNSPWGGVNYNQYMQVMICYAMVASGYVNPFANGTTLQNRYIIIHPSG